MYYNIYLLKPVVIIKHRNHYTYINSSKQKFKLYNQFLIIIDGLLFISMKNMYTDLDEKNYFICKTTRTIF